MKYKVTATIDVGYETIIEVNSDNSSTAWVNSLEEVEQLARDRAKLDFRLWRKASHKNWAYSDGASLTLNGSNFKLEEVV